VAESWGQRVEKISTIDGKPIWVRALGAAEGAATTSHEGARVKAAASPEAPFPTPVCPTRKMAACL